MKALFVYEKMDFERKGSDVSIRDIVGKFYHGQLVVRDETEDVRNLTYAAGKGMRGINIYMVADPNPHEHGKASEDRIFLVPIGFLYMPIDGKGSKTLKFRFKYPHSVNNSAVYTFKEYYRPLNPQEYNLVKEEKNKKEGTAWWKGFIERIRYYSYSDDIVPNI